MSNDSQSPRRPSRHDLFTPLNHIIGYSEMLEEQAAAEGRQDLIRDLQSIASAGRRLVTLLNEAFAFAGTAAASDGTAEDASATSEQVVAEAVPSRLLVVDDNEMNRDMLSRRLVARGFVVTTAPGGRAALDLIAAEAFDAVLLDVMMPDLSGLEVLQVIRRDHSVADLPVIMVTSRDSSADVVQALRLGANDYVTKPLDFAVVLARIETQLALKRANEMVRSLNQQLRGAQEKIVSLAHSSAEALRDIPGWAASVAADLAQTVNAEEIAVFLLDGESMKPVRPTALPAPNVDQTVGDSFVAISGMTGRSFGAVVIAGKQGGWSDPERHVMATFARQLGGTLELQQVRNELEESRSRQVAARRGLMERGLTLLELCPECGRCYSAPATTCEIDRSPLDGRLLPFEIQGRYRLARLLGSGGMGDVFCARDDRLGREVAVKVIRPEHFNNASMRIRFGREAKALARIQHEGVTAIHDSGELEDGSAFLVMEMLEGRDLRKVLNLFGRGTPAQVARLLRKGGGALSAAHRAGLIHRDVKPANIFLVKTSDPFEVKLLDFGLVKPIEIDTSLTQSGMFVGTPAYMAPELIVGDEADVRSDVYSFAAVAYEALTGRRVIVGEGRGVFMDVLYRDPPVVSSMLPGIPHEVNEAFRLALSKDPDERPHIEQFVAISGLLDGLTHDGAGWPSDLLSPEWPELIKSGVRSATLLDPTARSGS